MKKATIKEVKKLALGVYRVTYESGATRHYTSLPKTAEKWLKENTQNENQPKVFKEGGKAVGGTVFSSDKDYTVLKVTKCFVWIYYGCKDEALKLKIRRDGNGNEYVEYTESGFGRGCCCTYTYRAA